MKNPKVNKITLAHDWFTQFGGAERVFVALHEMYPESLVYTLAYDKKLAKYFPGFVFKTSFLQFFYKIVPSLQYLFLLIPLAVKSLKKPDSKILLSSSSSYIKGLRVKTRTVHINYCHTPTRFLWTEPGYVEEEVPFFFRTIMKLYLKGLKKWDLAAAKKVDFFIANSKEVQKRIKEFYFRDSEIIYPFVDVDFWKKTREKENYFLIAGRLQAHKNNELIVKIFTKLNKPLHVVGTGRQEEYLKSIAGPNINFFGRLSDEELREQYSGALAFIYPQFEDFGIMPLEAASCGTATIGWAKGGSLETIIPGITGELFEKQNEEELINIIQRWDSSKYSEVNLFSHAKKFNKQRFKAEIENFISKALGGME